MRPALETARRTIKICADADRIVRLTSNVRLNGLPLLRIVLLVATCTASGAARAAVACGASCQVPMRRCELRCANPVATAVASSLPLPRVPQIYRLRVCSAASTRLRARFIFLFAALSAGLRGPVNTNVALALPQVQIGRWRNAARRWRRRCQRLPRARVRRRLIHPSGACSPLAGLRARPRR